MMSASKRSSQNFTWCELVIYDSCQENFLTISMMTMSQTYGYDWSEEKNTRYGPTQPAADKWESAVIPSSFIALTFFWSDGIAALQLARVEATNRAA